MGEFYIREDLLNKLGITSDYVNELNQLAGYLSYQDLIKERPDAEEKLKHAFAIERIAPLRRYDERYDQGEFPKLITPKNQRRVQRINELVDETNRLLGERVDDPDKYRALAGRIYFWTNGKYHRMFPKESLRYDFAKK